MKTSIISRRPVSSGVAAAILLPLCSILIFLLCLQLTGNFHTVIAGELYRSAQPTAAQLESYIHEHGIKTVINLRGRNDRDWYTQETAVANRLGVQHIDFRMSASKILSPDRADELLAIMKSAPKPILLHCQSGADRTGLASVIYSRIAGIAESVAERQLSIYYGHVSIPYLSAAYAMDESWERLEQHFGMETDRDAKAGTMPKPSGKPSGVLIAATDDDSGPGER